MDVDAHSSPCRHAQRPAACLRRHRKQSPIPKSSLALSVLAASVPAAMAQDCISLQGSTACPAFSSASVSTGLTARFSFLSFVSDVESFDSQLRQYIATDWSREQYQERFGCSDVNLSNTTDIYARYSTSYLCNALVQNSIENCGLSNENSTPLCADSCAQFAISEQAITASPDLCGTPNGNANNQIRADFAQCQLPDRSLSGDCIDAVENEPDECGYQSNLEGLCAFCGDSAQNSTDSCCINANVEARCANVNLPTFTSMPPLFPSSTSAGPAATSTEAGAGAASSGAGLSGGAIAGIVVGSLVGAGLILAAVILCCIHVRKRQRSQHDSMLNTPSPTRQSLRNVPPPMSYGGDGHGPATVLPGARVARMSALESSNSSNRHSSRGDALGAYRGVNDDTYESPESGRSNLGGPPPKREGSLSSHSALAVTSGHTSPHSGSNPDRNFSSPEGVASGQSEQLQFFKDYYSQDDIHPNDSVAVLWAYQPRANDEWGLERGDMLKVVGIWDDGWATGVKLTQSAEEWEAKKSVQRDSGISNGSRQSRTEGENEIKAFPLVCVCLPQHWRKTIEGDSTDTGPGNGVAMSSSPSPDQAEWPAAVLSSSPPPLKFTIGPRLRHSRTPPLPPGLIPSGSSTLINSPHQI